MSAADATVTMGFRESGQPAYLAASHYLVDHCDMLIAVWDGSESSGTGVAVAYARDSGKPITIVWPNGAERS